MKRSGPLHMVSPSSAPSLRQRVRSALPWAGAGLAGLLLATAFPPFGWSDAALVALVPLLLALGMATSVRPFRLGFATGVVFWLLTLHWLAQVTIVGWFLLALCCAAYWGLFALAAAPLLRKRLERPLPLRVGVLLLVPMLWVGTEYLRSTLFTGFPWNPLGVSQYRVLPMIQIAEWGGVYAVSAVLALMNAAVAITIQRYVQRGPERVRFMHAELILAFLGVILCLALGFHAQKRLPAPSRSLRAALVQPCIPQNQKWTTEFIGFVYGRLEQLTRDALRAGTPDLVVWPETALPDDVRNSEESFRFVHALAREGAPLLVGSMDVEWRDDGLPRYFNSSFLFDAEGVMVEGYDKQHLVLLGEYVPLHRQLPFLSTISPIEESFSPGTRSTVFRVPGSKLPFGVLICFEDTVAPLARRAVRAGARLLVNQTNDAWFDPTSGSLQHMSHGVFRSVENRVPTIRSTNTGVTCAIDRRGRIIRILEDAEGGFIVPGFLMAEVEVPPDDAPLTFYARHGDVFAGTGAALWVLAMCAQLRASGRLARWRRGRRARGSDASPGDGGP